MAKAAGLICIFLLLASLCCWSLAQKAPGTPEKCCFTFQKSRIKKGNIVGWFLTSPECSHRAVVFKTRIGKEICADPDKRWVKKYQEFFHPNSLSVPT